MIVAFASSTQVANATLASATVRGMTPEQLQQYRVERLAAALAHKFDGNRSEMGRALGYKDGAFIRQMLSEARPISEKTVQAIEALPGMSDWFSPAARNRLDATINVFPLTNADELPDGVVAVPEWDVRFSAGNGHEASYEIVEDSEPAYYRRDWFTKEGINPTRVRRFRVTGNSMEPFVYAGDHVLVNLAETEVIDGKVYALRYDAELRIKRLLRHLDGTLILRSDNPQYVDEMVPPALVATHISIIGRVRDRSGSGGL